MVSESRGARRDAASGLALALVPRAVWAPLADVSHAVALARSAARLLTGVRDAVTRGGLEAVLMAGRIARGLEAVLDAETMGAPDRSERTRRAGPSLRLRLRGTGRVTGPGLGSASAQDKGSGDFLLALLDCVAPTLRNWAADSMATAHMSDVASNSVGAADAAAVRVGDMAGARAMAAGCTRAVWLVHCMLVGVSVVGAGRTRLGEDEEDEDDDPRRVGDGSEGTRRHRADRQRDRAMRRAWGLTVEAALGGFQGLHTRMGGAAQQQLLDASGSREKERMLSRSTGHVLARRTGPLLSELVICLEQVLAWAEGVPREQTPAHGDADSQGADA